jgi:hypothetical protein
MHKLKFEVICPEMKYGSIAEALTLIRVAIKKSVAGRLKVIYDPHIVQ